MLEPFACLSIATAIAQFIDFGVKVLRTAHDLQNGATRPKELENFQKDVSSFKILCRSVKQAHGQHHATLEQDGHAITDVASQCEDLAASIQSTLDKVQVRGKPNIIRSLKTALQAQVKHSEFERHEQLLMAAKVDLCTQMVKALGMSVFVLIERYRN